MTQLALFIPSDLSIPIVGCVSDSTETKFLVSNPSPQTSGNDEDDDDDCDNGDNRNDTDSEDLHATLSSSPFPLGSKTFKTLQSK